MMKPWLSYKCLVLPLTVLLTCGIYTTTHRPLHISSSHTHSLPSLHAFNSSRMNNHPENDVLKFLPELKNPCFLTDFNSSLSDEQYYSAQPLIRALEQKYSQSLVPRLHRAAITLETSEGALQTRRLRCLPYFYVLGVAKSGSTDFYQRLSCHRDFTKAVRKENAWFSRWRFDNYSLADYVDVFDPAASQIRQRLLWRRPGEMQVPLVVGDHSSNTFTSRTMTPGANRISQDLPVSSAALICTLTPNARFIVMFRSPPQRAYSHYKMHHAKSPSHFHSGVRLAVEWLSACFQREGFSDHCLYWGYPLEHTNYSGITSVRGGIYYPFVKEWLTYFPKNQFLFLKSEEYFADTYTTIHDSVFPFLGLETPIWYDYMKECIESKTPVRVSSRKIRTREKDIDVNYMEPMLEETRKLLEDFYGQYNRQLAQLLQHHKWLWL